MIFVTVGTHEQPFNRLVKAVDELKLNNEVSDDIFIQTGYSTYVPKACEHKKFISMKEMDNYVAISDVIITHGGPSSFIMALQHNKIPLVVPRLAELNEHVNNHQLTFCNELLARNFPIKVVNDVSQLQEEIESATLINRKNGIHLNNEKFIQQFKIIADQVLNI